MKLPPAAAIAATTLTLLLFVAIMGLLYGLGWLTDMFVQRQFHTHGGLWLWFWLTVWATILGGIFSFRSLLQIPLRSTPFHSRFKGKPALQVLVIAIVIVLFGVLLWLTDWVIARFIHLSEPLWVRMWVWCFFWSLIFGLRDLGRRIASRFRELAAELGR
jgi:hypothetical protein